MTKKKKFSVILFFVSCFNVFVFVFVFRRAKSQMRKKKTKNKKQKAMVKNRIWKEDNVQNAMNAFNALIDWFHSYFNYFDVCGIFLWYKKVADPWSNYSRLYSTFSVACFLAVIARILLRLNCVLSDENHHLLFIYHSTQNLILYSMIYK